MGRRRASATFCPGRLFEASSAVRAAIGHRGVGGSSHAGNRPYGNGV